MIKQNRFSNHGSLMAEAALIIPILLGIAIFIIELGNIFNLTNHLNQAARSAARYAAVTTSYTQQDLIDKSGASELFSDITKFSLTASPLAGSAKSVGTTISITTQYTYTPVANPFGFFGSSNSWAPVLTGSSSVRSEVSYAP